MVKRIILFISLVAISYLTYSQDGSLDITFDDDGIMYTDFGYEGNSSCNGVLIQGSRILASGLVTENDKALFVVARFNENGELDQTFGSQGKTVIDFGLNGDNIGKNMSLDPNGKIYFIGEAYENSLSSFAIARLTSDGIPDPTFGENGIKMFQFGDELSSKAYHAVCQPDGKLIVVGHTEDGEDNFFAIARLLDDGDFDPTFGSQGKIQIDFGVEFNNCKYVSLLENNKILVGGNGLFAKLNEDGSLDPSFGNDGKVIINNFSSRGIAIQRDKKIVSVGEVKPDNNAAIIRLTEDGQLDPTFDADGMRIVELVPQNQLFFNCSIQCDKQIVAVGHGRDDNGNWNLIKTRLQEFGAYDQEFQTGANLYGADNLKAVDLTMQNDDKILVATTFEKDGQTFFGLVRLNNTNKHLIEASSGENGSIDPSGDIVVIDGDNQMFNIAPDEGYKIDQILVDDSDEGSETTYTFDDINSDHSIHVIFVEEASSITESGELKLFEISPNPFDQSARAVYRLTVGGNVNIKLYDLLGNMVYSDLDTYREAGEHSFIIDGRNLENNTYYLTIEVNGKIAVRNIIVLH